MKRKLLSLLLAGTLAFSAQASFAKGSPYETNIKIYQDNVELKLRDKVYIAHDRTLVPLRFLSEQFGYDVDWDKDREQVKIKCEGFEATFEINHKSFQIKEREKIKKKELETATCIIKDRAYVPLRAMEDFNQVMYWDGNSQSIFVYNAKKYQEDPQPFDEVRKEIIAGKVSGLGKDTLNKTEKKEKEVGEKPQEAKSSSRNEENFKTYSYQNLNVWNSYTDQQRITSAAIEEQNKIFEHFDGYNDVKEVPSFSKAQKEMEKHLNALKDNPQTVVANMDRQGFTSTDSAERVVFIKRSNLRRIPTNRQGGDGSLDYNQETEVQPWTRAWALHKSKDGKWTYVMTPRFFAWTETKNIAPAEETYLDSIMAQDKAVVVKDRIKINNVQYDMGALLPVLKENESSFTVLTPGEDSDGKLSAIPAEVSKDQLQSFPLPYSDRTLVSAAYQFLNREYGWGGLKESTDCSGLINDVYGLFGIRWPRNSWEMERSGLGEFVDLAAKSSSEKKKILSQSPIGTVVFMKGHVMLYIGNDRQGEPLVIHEHGPFSYKGKKYPSGCTVTNLDILNSSGTPYIKNVRSLIKF